MIFSRINIIAVFGKFKLKIVWENLASSNVRAYYVESVDTCSNFNMYALHLSTSNDNNEVTKME